MTWVSAATVSAMNPAMMNTPATTELRPTLPDPARFSAVAPQMTTSPTAQIPEGLSPGAK